MASVSRHDRRDNAVDMPVFLAISVHNQSLQATSVRGWNDYTLLLLLLVLVTLYIGAFGTVLYVLAVNAHKIRPNNIPGTSTLRAKTERTVRFHVGRQGQRFPRTFHKGRSQEKTPLQRLAVSSLRGPRD